MVKQLSLANAEKLLKKYRIPYPKSHTASNKDDVVKLAKKIGYPVVLKVSSEKIIHKTDKGGVKTSIPNQKVLEKAYDSIVQSTKSKTVMIQKMVKGTHVLVGMKKDPAFGPVIAFGLGGIFVEVLKDVEFRVAPISRHDALDMIKSIKSYPILKGIRGQKGVNIKLLVKILLKVSKLAMKERRIKELDLNPIIINSKEAKAVDARFLI